MSPDDDLGEESVEKQKDPSTQEKTPFATVIQGAGWIFGGRIVKLFVGFVAQILIARVLGTTSYGSLSLAVTVIAFSGLIAGLGVNRGVKRNIAYYEDEPKKARGIARAGLVISLGSYLATGVGLLLLAPVIAERVFGNPDLTLLIRIAALGMPFGALKGIGTAVATGSRDATTHATVNQVLGPVTRSALVISMALLGFGAAGVVAGRTLSTILMAGIALWLAWRVFPLDIRGKSESMYRELLTFSIPLMFAGWTMTFIDETDYLILGIFQPDNVVGTYTAMFTLLPVILLFFFPATFLLSPVITRLQKQEELKRARQTYQGISKWTTLVTLPLFLLAFLFPQVVIRVTFGADYLGGATVLRILAISGLVRVALGANDRVLIGLGHSKASMYVSGIAAVSNVVLNVVLIPLLGMFGAAVASLTAFVLRNLANSALLYRWYGLVPYSRAMSRVLLAVAGLTSIGYIGFTNFFPTRFIHVTLLGMVFLLIYFPLVIRLGAPEPIDRQLFLEVEESQDLNLDWLKRVLKRIMN